MSIELRRLVVEVGGAPDVRVEPPRFVESEMVPGMQYWTPWMVAVDHHLIVEAKNRAVLVALRDAVDAALAQHPEGES